MAPATDSVDHAVDDPDRPLPTASWWRHQNHDDGGEQGTLTSTSTPDEGNRKEW
jgi:hypothetical protein